MRNELLLITQTHGNEFVGTKAVKKLGKFANFDWIIGNELASEQNKRFINHDLNRIAPGEIKSKDYELKRAAVLVSLSKKYKYTIDIHGTDATSGIFIIITNPKIENIIFALSLPIDNIVVWCPENRKKGPITKFARCGLEIECGPQNSKIVLNKLISILKNVLSNQFTLNNFKGKKLFQVYGKLYKTKDNKRIETRDFQKITIDSEEFYPLLPNQYEDVICYKMRKINLISLSNIYNFHKFLTRPWNDCSQEEIDSD
jgi:hypothetical protein